MLRSGSSVSERGTHPVSRFLVRGLRRAGPSPRRPFAAIRRATTTPTIPQRGRLLGELVVKYLVRRVVLLYPSCGQRVLCWRSCVSGAGRSRRAIWKSRAENSPGLPHLDVLPASETVSAFLSASEHRRAHPWAYIARVLHRCGYQGNLKHALPAGSPYGLAICTRTSRSLPRSPGRNATWNRRSCAREGVCQVSAKTPAASRVGVRSDL